MKILTDFFALLLFFILNFWLLFFVFWKIVMTFCSPIISYSLEIYPILLIILLLISLLWEDMLLMKPLGYILRWLTIALIWACIGAMIAAIDVNTLRITLSFITLIQQASTLFKQSALFLFVFFSFYLIDAGIRILWFLVLFSSLLFFCLLLCCGLLLIYVDKYVPNIQLFIDAHALSRCFG